MADAFSFKKGVRLPSRTITLSGNGLTTLVGVDQVVFVYRKKGVAERNEIIAVVTDAAAMKVRVDFGALDVDEIATYQWQCEAVVGGERMAFPEKGFYTFSVTENIEAV
jgi:hypothetical protein